MLTTILGLFLIVHLGTVGLLWILALYAIVIKGERPTRGDMLQLFFTSIVPVLNTMILIAATLAAIRELREEGKL